MITDDEIEKIVRDQGLIAGAQVLAPSDRNNENLIEAIARGASSRIDLLSDADIDALGKLHGSSFFNIQIVLCQVIPHLVRAPSEIMALVSTLVEQGGEDLAANQPNAAFLKWCAKDDRRAAEVIASARAGDPLALRHLVFALQATGDPQEAQRSAKNEGDERAAGVFALSRMTLDENEALSSLSTIVEAIESVPHEEAAGLIKAALDIAEKHPTIDRSEIATVLDQLSGSTDPTAVHMMATALYWHGKKMSDREVASCLRGLLSINPEKAATVQQAEAALSKLWPEYPGEIGQTVAALISKTQGQVGGDSLRQILSDDTSELASERAHLATEWLLEGDHQMCTALGHCFSEVNSTEPNLNVPPDVLPASAEDQIFVCRKAIGYFFIAPMTAASWIIAVLRKGGASSPAAADLLFDPLLLNYGGALREWLESLLQKRARGNKFIREALERAEVIWEGFEKVKEVVELEPSSSQRALVRFQEAEESERIHESAREKSLFASLLTTQTLLYGDRSSYSIMDNEGIRQPQTIKMGTMSVESELPKGIFFDPTGTDLMLEAFRFERRDD